MQFLGRFLTISILMMIVPVDADAWGTEGHQVIAAVAEQRLNPAAKAGVTDLLRTDSMESVASRADTVARTTHSHSAKWHYVNTPYDSEGYDEARDCVATERGDCVVLAIPRLERILLDPNASQVDRREALMFLIHFVGDLHNPIHAIQMNDTSNATVSAGPGGIGTQVELAGQTTTLHQAWDAGIIQLIVKTEPTLSMAVENWLKQYDQHTPVVVDPSAWAAESFQIGKTLVYPQAADGIISEEEAQVAMEAIEKRIALAGVRLAAILNQIFTQLNGSQ